jgi:phenylpropionate dioxygenase-like ring-hydroxylating dioxygenase large terminal subunit
MLRPEDNKLITEVGPGTPMGEVFRRFWLPVVASEDMEDPDGAPVRLRVLGENLVAFRDTDGRVGVLSAYCPHRRANLFFARNEESGLRCIYHGWKFDVTGKCVDIPSEPAHSTFKDRVRAPGYPTVERGGLVWVYMGPPEQQPEFPEYEWAEVPDNQRVISASLVECNWLQTLEGDIDTAHVSFLHRPLDTRKALKWARFVDSFSDYVSKDRSPSLTVKATDYGFVYGGRRVGGEEDYYWRFSHWIAPSTSETPGSAERPGRIVVPIDDDNSMSFAFVWHPHRPLSAEEAIANGRNNGQLLEPWQLADGYVIDTRRSPLNRDNDFKIDRHVQRTKRFSGIMGTPPEEDRAMTETMEPVLDRSKEHLGTSDVAIIAMRRRLIKMARDIEQGIEPALAKQPWAFRTRGYDVVSRHGDFDTVLAEHQDELTPPRAVPGAP